MIITVRGQPAPQGSKRAFIIRGGPRKGQAAVIESSHDRVKSWRQAVVEAALNARQGTPPFIGPLSVSMVFTLPRPKSHYRTGKLSHLIRDSAPLHPARMPDLSKLQRSTEDALTDAGIWADDSLVVEYVRVAKVYAGEMDALDTPGAVITIGEAL